MSKELQPRAPTEVDLIAGVVCLDFVNTVEPRAAAQHGGQPGEHLVDYAAFLAWSLHADTLNRSEAEQLSRRALQRPAAAITALTRARELREAIYRVFYAMAEQREPAAADLETIGEAYAEASEHMRLTAHNRRFTVAWGGEPDDLDRPLWPLARSAVELLLGADPARIKDCDTGGAGCGWLFYDTSKNNSRRWCSMRGCGGPEKERRRAERRRAAGRT